MTTMTMQQARAKYRRAKKTHTELHPDEPMPFSMRAYARWLCVGDVKTTGKLAEICRKQAAVRFLAP